MVEKKFKMQNEKCKITTVKIGKMTLKNPVIAASGTFGYGSELKDYLDADKLGAIVTKTITLKAREGNPLPRIVETPSGMLNSIGLENKGLNDFILNKSRELKNIKTNIIVSIAGDSPEEFSVLAGEISKLPFVSAIELNLSCPNVKRGTAKKFKLAAQDPESTGKIVRAARAKTKLTLITKLSPNVTDIKEIAKAAERAGSDAISLINTIFGLSVDIGTGKPNLGNVIGGLSGPAIKPVALYFVREARKAVRIPIIGAGGIMTADDAVEFMMCGASAVQVGTGNFIDPALSIKIISGIMRYFKEKKIKRASDLTGSIKE